MVAALVAVLCLSAAAHAQPTVVTVGTHELLLKDDVTPPLQPGSRKFTFNVRSGEAAPEHQVVMPAPGSSGDPTPAGATGGGATLEVYNTAGSGELNTLYLPASGWRLTGNPFSGHRYIYAGVGAVWKVWIKGTKISIRGGKSAWGYTLDEPSQGTIGIRLTLASGITWCSEAVANTSGTPPSSADYDRPGRFQAKRIQDAPAMCPPLP